MESQYTWLSIGNDAPKGFLEIMGAPISDPKEFLETISGYLKDGTTLCIGGEIKTSEEGKPASNFRYEKDQELNGNVIENYIQLFNLHRDVFRSKPIFVTTIPRSWRKYSWFIQEDGIMVRKDQEYRKRADDPTDPISYQGFPDGEDAMDIVDVDFMRFLSYNRVTQEHMSKIRECCKGARYHTYLADMFSFLYQIRVRNNFITTFYPEYRELDIISEPGKPDKLCFEKTMEQGFVFLCPKKTSVDSIYQDFGEAISLEENEMKAKIRKHLLENRINRWTDFSANDIDDAFTILMLIQAFNGLTGENRTHGCAEGVFYVPTREEQIILDGLHSSLDEWRSQLE
jgi:hypothetical protein